METFLLYRMANTTVAADSQRHLLSLWYPKAMPDILQCSSLDAWQPSRAAEVTVQWKPLCCLCLAEFTSRKMNSANCLSFPDTQLWSTTRWHIYWLTLTCRVGFQLIWENWKQLNCTSYQLWHQWFTAMHLWLRLKQVQRLLSSVLI